MSARTRSPKSAAATRPSRAARRARMAELMPRDVWASRAGVTLDAATRTDPDAVTVRLRVGAKHRNIYGFCHGGVIFSLADCVFGLTCNAAGEVAVALDAHIAFTRAVRLGEEMLATCHELTRTRRTGTYRVEVCTAGGEPVAHFLGTAYMPGPATPPEAAPARPTRKVRGARRRTPTRER